jgi:hypothetical protein
MNESPNPAFNDYMSHVNADRDEAVLFLANIIAKKDRDLIRSKMDNGSRVARARLEHMFLGMNIRNALRGAGFSYDLHTMECIWYDWLMDAVSLPDEKVVLTDNIKMRKSRYREFMEKEGKLQANLSTKHELVSEKMLVTSMALIALLFFIISLALHWFT